MDNYNLYKTLRRLYPNGDSRFYKVMIELMTLYNDKQSDYATIEEPFRNFTDVADNLVKYGIITEENKELKVALVYAYKQWDAICKMIGQGNKGKAESLIDKLNDISVYAIIIRILYEEKIKCQ